MKLLIEKLIIKNFKGLKEQEINFGPEETTIAGDNGTGKTTVVDAFTWLLFEKDSQGRSQFEIKTLENGKVIHGLDHEVEGHFRIDGRALKLRKVYKETWTKRSGDDERTFTGHKIERFSNDVPVTKTDYDKKINELVDEGIFQLLTDPRYFSTKLHWTDRRKALFDLAGGEIDREDVFLAEPKLKAIAEDLEDKTIEELKEALKYQRNQTNKDRENIPVKIDTLHSTIKEIDKDTLDIKMRTLKGSIKRIEDQMVDAAKLNDEQLKKHDTIFKLKSKAKELEFEIRSSAESLGEDLKLELKENHLKLSELNQQLSMEELSFEHLAKEIKNKQKELDKLRTDYQTEMDKELEVDPDIKECPTCLRPFDEAEVNEKVAALEGNFKENQVKILTDLRDKGHGASLQMAELEVKQEESTERIEKKKKEIEALKAWIEEKEKAIKRIEDERPSIEEMLLKSPQYQATLKAISSTEKQMAERDTDSLIKDLRAKKDELEEELRGHEKELHQDEINQETKNKIQELMDREKELSFKLNEIERKQSLVDSFITTQAKLIEKNINEKFKFVSFRLFRIQTNGGLDETCEALVDGVPFDNANTAGQINAGLDIINSLCKHYDTYTPIFIDNRESINELIPTDSQLINLKVTKHKTLRVEVE